MTPKEKYQDIDASASVLPEKAIINLKQLKPILFDKKYQTEEYSDTRKKAEEKMNAMYDKIAKDYPDAIKSKVAKQPEPKTPQAMAQKAAKQTIKQPTVKNPKATAGATKRGNVTKLAKEIRKDGETWHAAMKRAGEMINKEKGKAVKKANVQYEKLKAFLAKNPSIEKTMVTYGKKPNQGTRPLDVKRDAARVAKPKGKRVSSEGKTYYEYRANRTDSSRKRYPYLELGGKLFGAGYFAKGGYFKGNEDMFLEIIEKYKTQNGYDDEPMDGDETVTMANKVAKQYGFDAKKKKLFLTFADYNQGNLDDEEVDKIESSSYAKGGYFKGNEDMFLEIIEKYKTQNGYDDEPMDGDETVTMANKVAKQYGFDAKKKKLFLTFADYNQGNLDDEEVDKIESSYAKGGEFGHTFNGAGKFEEGGYITEGEDYEYVNTFGIPQEDFIMLVDAWHKNESSNSREAEREYFDILNSLDDKYGKDIITDIIIYVEDTHDSNSEVGKLVQELGHLEAAYDAESSEDYRKDILRQIRFINHQLKQLGAEHYASGYVEFAKGGKTKSKTYKAEIISSGHGNKVLMSKIFTNKEDAIDFTDTAESINDDMWYFNLYGLDKDGKKIIKVYGFTEYDEDKEIELDADYVKAKPKYKDCVEWKVDMVRASYPTNKVIYSKTFDKLSKANSLVGDIGNDLLYGLINGVYFEDYDEIEKLAKGGKTNNGDNLPNTVEEYFAAMNNFSMRLGEAEANFANDNGASYQRVLAERDEFFEKVKAKWYAELNEAEGNFAKDGGKSYEAALKKLDDARLRFAKGGEITPKVNSQIVERAKIIYADNNGSTKEDFDMAYHQAIREAGYNVEEFISTMKNIGADYGHEGDDYYAKGGKVKGRLSDTHKYVPNRMIQEIEVERRGKTSFIDGADILDGVYVKKGVKFAHGGSMPHVHSKKHRNG